jgi:hypothetical protein
MTIKNQKEKPIKKLVVETINWRREVHQYHEPKPLSHLLWSSNFQGHCFYSVVVSLSICQHIMKRSLPMDRKAKIARQSSQSQHWQLFFRPLLLSAVPNHVSSAYTDSCFANQKKASTLICNSAHRIMCALCISHLNKALHHGDQAPLQHLKRKWHWNPLTSKRCTSA